MKTSIPLRSRCVWTALLLAALVCAPAALAQSPTPTLSKSFNPSTIGPGSTSSLVFVISNPSGTTVRNLSFTDTLPAGVTIADPASATTNCFNGVVSAPAGGSTISFTGDGIGASSSCTVRVNVTSGTPGSHENTSSGLSSDAGTSAPATATLVVDAARPGFSKSFSPSSIFFGERSRLTFTIDNTANGSEARNLTFSDTLPSGVVVASPANATSTCSGGIVNAPGGSSTVSYGPAIFGGATVAAGATCTVAVDVVGNSVGLKDNVSGELTSTAGTSGISRSSGFATARLTVSTLRLSIEKTFTDDPASPGGTVNLRFTIRNLDRRDAATNIAFSDDLDAALGGLAAVSLPSNPCGSGSTLSGSGVITLAGGNLPAEGVCTFDVGLAVPSSAEAGSYVNTSGAVSGEIGGDSVVGNSASDTLFVVVAPGLAKSFTDDPVGAGGVVTLEFTITNPSADAMTDVAFSDTLPIVITSAVTTPGADPCGAGSTSNFTPRFISGSGSTPAQFSLSGGSLAGGASCTFSLTLNVAGDAPTGTFPNVTSEITATLQGETVSGAAASDNLQVVGGARLRKVFVGDPVAAGDTVVLRFTLTLPEASPGDATGISFSDDLDAALSGLASISGTLNDVCGTGSQISGTSTLSFTGGTLSPGAQCSFDVTLQVPSGAAPGAYTNTTSNVASTVLGTAVSRRPANDDLNVAGLVLSKEFIDDPVRAGGTATLRFTLSNVTPATNITDIQFTDDLDQNLAGLAASAGELPQSDVCGTGSSLFGSAGDTFLTLAGGSLAAGASCSFDVVLDVPLGAEDGFYDNFTSSVLATVGAQTVAFTGAGDALEVTSQGLVLEKEFTDDPVAPGGTATLRFTITNTDENNPVTDLAFTDDLDAALSGLQSVSGTQNDVCGTGSQVSGTSTVSLTGGSLPAGGGCTFTVSVLVPSAVELGEEVVNTTSVVSGTLGPLPVFGAPASDVLLIDFVAFSKSFGGDVTPGDTVVLTFNIENLSGSESAGPLEFTDDLSAVLTGLASISGTQNDVCGAGSSLSGSSTLVFSGGNLLPGGSCTFSATLQVPLSAAAGSYANQTSDLFEQGLRIADMATAVLTVIADVDGDDDGVDDAEDACPNTVIPEGVPTERLGVNRYALVDGDGIFDTTHPNGNGPQETFTIQDTKGCSCEQIIDILGLGKGHTKFGCSLSAMRDFVELVN